MNRADRSMLEAEAEELGPLVYTPDAVSIRLNQWVKWFTRHPFSLDLVSCAETNS